MQDDNSTKDVPLITHLKTNDVDEIVIFARGWDQEYTQLKKGPFDWYLTLIQIGNFQFYEVFCGSPLLLRGSTPSGTFTLGIPKVLVGENLYGGHLISQRQSIAANCDGHLDLRTDKLFHIFAITAPIEQILACAEQMQRSLSREQQLSPGLILPNPTALQQLSDYLEELLLLAKTHPDRLTDISQGNSMTHIILEDSLPLLVDVLTSNSNFLPEKQSRRRKLVKRAEVIMRDRINTPITLTDLCQEVKTSQRSLYYAFEESFGLPPMQYLKILRLNGVRRALKSANRQTAKVAKIAGNYGFWHMGQFSTDYRIMFGESPSTTLSNQ